MPLIKVVELAKGFPPLEALYHKMLMPVAVKLPTVGFAPLQKVWDEEPVGGDDGVIRVTVTLNLILLSQPFVFWLA